MTKKWIMLVSFIALIGSFILINKFQDKNFTVFNNVSPQRIEEVKLNLSEADELDFTALLCNEMRVPFDEQTNTFFVPLDMDNPKWEKTTKEKTPKKNKRIIIDEEKD